MLQLTSFSFAVFGNEGRDDNDDVDEELKLKFCKFDDDTLKVNDVFFGGDSDDDDDDDDGDEVVIEFAKQRPLFPSEQDEPE